MHHLRKDRPSPGHIRTRLLGGGRSGPSGVRLPLCALLAAGLALALTSCGPGKPSATGGAAWYELASTVFQSVGAADGAPQCPALPWTVQSRVTDMAFLGNTLYLAVNGAGVAAVDSDADGALSFRYHYETPIFAHRTITTLIPRHGDLLIHLYYNALLNDARPEELLLQGISLVTYLPGQKAFAFLIPPFQKKNPSWEAVGFAPISENEFDFEWKHTDSAETQFAYTRYRADLRLEAGSNRDAFMAALGTPSLSGPGVPPAYSAFFQECRAHIKGLAEGTALHFKVRSRGVPVQRYFRSGLELDSILLIHVLDEDGALFALLPDGQVLEKASDNPPQVFPLPPLPAGFRYTDFVKMGDRFIVSWEETQFTQVGRAGIAAVRISPPLP
jgi:hypothetical protein